MAHFRSRGFVVLRAEGSGFGKSKSRFVFSGAPHVVWYLLDVL